MAFKPTELDPRPAGTASAARSGAPTRPPRLSTEMLMAGRREIVLLHGHEEYRLRITSTGKLILTK
jgi:hemin uptake protein HemP